MAPDERLSRERRVRKRQDFLRIQGSRHKFRSTHLLLAVASPGRLADGRSTSRLGITVTRKVDKRAARRNRIKRWIRDVFRKEREHFTEPVDLVVIALEGAAELDFKQISWELRGVLMKAGLLRNAGARGRAGGQEKETRK